MRDDMFEVIIERPRIRSRSRYPRAVRRREAQIARHDPDRLPRAAGMKRPSQERDAVKYLNENLVPLRRYLVRQVNRPWNKVWSEIAGKLKPQSTVQQHVRDHIADFVARQTFIKDGEIWIADGRRFAGAPCPLSRSSIKLYVDPRTGLLRRNTFAKGWRQEKRDRARERAGRMREISLYVQAHNLGKHGWWEVILAPTTLMPHEIKWTGIDVVLNGGLSTLWPDDLYGRRGVYAVARRRLSKRDVARLHAQKARA
jgi:hypothetical protein